MTKNQGMKVGRTLIKFDRLFICGIIGIDNNCFDYRINQLKIKKGGFCDG